MKLICSHIDHFLKSLSMNYTLNKMAWSFHMFSPVEPGSSMRAKESLERNIIVGWVETRPHVARWREQTKSYINLSPCSWTNKH